MRRYNQVGVFRAAQAHAQVSYEPSFVLIRSLVSAPHPIELVDPPLMGGISISMFIIINTPDIWSEGASNECIKISKYEGPTLTRIAGKQFFDFLKTKGWARNDLDL